MPDSGAPGDSALTTACSDAAAGPLGLTCADFPGVAPCPNQALLSDATKLAALKAALTSGALVLENDDFDGGDPDIYKVVCGREGYWDPSHATTLIPPATPVPILASLFAPSPDGYAGVCASFMAWSAAGDGFPAAGTYRKQVRATYGGQTYTVRARYTASGTAAGQTFVAAGLSDADYYASTDVAAELVFQVNGTTVPEATVWPSLVSAFASSTTTFPTATLAVKESASGPAIWTGTFDLLCASVMPEPDAGPAALGQQAIIPLAGSASALTYNTGTKKAYVGLSAVSDAGYTVPAGIAVASDASNAVTSTIATSGLVVALAANGTTSKVYASEQTQIDVIDSATDTITTTVPVPGNDNAQGMAVDLARNLVYVLGGSQVYVLDGATNVFRAMGYPFTGFAAPIAAFTGGKSAIAYDATTATLYVIGLDSSLNGVVQAINATTGVAGTQTSLMADQPTSVVALPGGAAVTVVDSSGGSGVVLVGQSPTVTSYVASSLAVCGTTLAVVGSDSTGLAAFQAFTPTATALGAPVTPDPSALQLNGAVPANLVAAGASGTGCSFYGTYTYNPNALYSGNTGHAPPPPPLLVRFAN